MNKSNTCLFCNGQKMVTIHKKMTSDEGESVYTQDVPVYDLSSWLLDPDVKAGDVFCDDCGIMYCLESIWS